VASGTGVNALAVVDANAAIIMDRSKIENFLLFAWLAISFDWETKIQRFSGQCVIISKGSFEKKFLEQVELMKIFRVVN